MIDNLLKQMRETLGDLNSLTPTKMKDLIETTVETFRDLKTHFESSDPAEREAAMSAVETIKEAFQEEANKLYKKAGMDPEVMSTFIKNPMNFTQSEWESVADMSKELESLNMQEPKTVRETPRRARRNKIVRLVG